MIRLGDIQFLNSWPVTYALRKGLIEADVAILSGSPAELNRKLLTGELDAGAISAAVYLRHLEEFIPIPGLCIRSDSGAQSVLVVSRQPLERLKGGPVALSNQGATTPILLKILFKRYRLSLPMEVTSLRYPQVLEEYPAALLIGDEALQAGQRCDGRQLFAWDLGEAWSDWTRLPAVFALWVIRRTAVGKRPGLLEEVASALRASYEWSRLHPMELLSAMRKAAPFEMNFLIRYLAALSYDLDKRAWVSVRRFAREAEAIGGLPKGTALKLRQAVARESRMAVS